MALKLKQFLFLFCFIMLCKNIQSNSLKLEQVLILSRHNVRTPLASNLEEYAARKWPKFNEPVSHLTGKGALLESYIAEYISEWLASEDFIKGCPKQEDVLIYSNTKLRTRDTAAAFAKSAFPSCNISAHFYENVDVFDPLFYPIFHNNSEHFKQKMIKGMERRLNKTDLTEAYLELNRILNLKNSDICKQKFVCDFSVMKNKIVYEEGEEPNVLGALHLANSIVDVFIMSYYEGFPFDDVAWGQIKTKDQWKLLAKIAIQDQNVRFNHKPGAEDIAKPLLKYMFDILRSGNPKLTVLVGHDSNLNTVISALDFKEYVLTDQFEPFPIGGKLVFQKWSDGVNTYLKVEYIYQTTIQIRVANKLSLHEPPSRFVMELSNCKIDANGFCPWDDFVKFNF